MVSDKYYLKHTPGHLVKIFDIAEGVARCYGFDSKELLQVRLITEEMASAVHQAIVMRAGRIWFESDSQMFKIHISCNTDMFGMSQQQRDKLLALDEGGKKGGFFKPLKDYLNYMLVASNSNDEYLVYGDSAETQILCHMTMGMGFAEQPWHMAAIPWYKKGSQYLQPAAEEKDIDIEMSLIKGMADEIKVAVKGSALMLSAGKKIPVDFIQSYIDI